MFSFQGASLNLQEIQWSLSNFWGTSINLYLFTIHYYLLLRLSEAKGVWWAKMDSNHRPHDYQSCALASWAIGPSSKSKSQRSFKAKALNSPVSLFLLSNQNPLRWAFDLFKRTILFSLHQVHSVWWRLAGSNRWPPACKAGALPAELNPHNSILPFPLHPLNWITKIHFKHFVTDLRTLQERTSSSLKSP